MKKTGTLLAVVLVLGISLVAYAGAQKVGFFPGEGYGYEDGKHSEAYGFVIINRAPTEDVEVTIQIQIRDAAASYEYYVYSGGSLLGTFTTNKKGYGHFHCNLPSESKLGGYINIWAGDSISPSVNRILRAEI